MPNWCENELTITGPQADLDRLKEAVRALEPEEAIIYDDAGSRKEPFHPAFSFSRIIPYPEEYRLKDREVAEIMRALGDAKTAAAYNAIKEAHASALPKSGSNSGGDEWRIQNWGTKWEPICEPGSLSETPGKLHYSFDTASSPPTPVVIALAKLYPALTLTLKYWEGGMGYQGVLRVKEDSILIEYRGRYGGDRSG